MTKYGTKNNRSSIMVLKTLQMLLQDNYTMKELIKNLNAQEAVPVFNNSIVSKYINTCRYCNIEISKLNNKYYVANVPFGIELTTGDINLLENLQSIVKEKMSNKALKIFDNFIEKLNRFSNRKIAKVEKKTYKLATELFENAILEKRKINLILKNKKVIECVPLKIFDVKNKILFNVLEDGEEKNIDSSKVSGLEVLNKKFVHNFNKISVVFLLKGELASRYSLRENEHLVSTDRPGCIAVSNCGENKDILFSRLLRYDDM